MEDWKIALDRYLTSEPDGSFDIWYEKALEAMSEEFYEKNTDWIDEYDGLCNQWLNKLYYDKEPEEAGKIVERAFKVYKINQ